MDQNGPTILILVDVVVLIRNKAIDPYLIQNWIFVENSALHCGFGVNAHALKKAANTDASLREKEKASFLKTNYTWIVALF